jgi:hypothetical protein
MLHPAPKERPTMLKPILVSTVAALALVTRTLPAQEPASVRRTYDIAALAPAGGERTRVEHLLPFLDPHSDITDGASYAQICSDELSSLLTTLFAPELEQPGLFLQFEEPGVATLRAPQSVHASFAQLLEQLARQLRNETEIDVLYASVPSGDAALLPDGGLLAAADVAAIATRLQSGTGRSLARTTLRVPALSEGWFASAREIDALVDFDVEIAQGATTADPITMSLSTGLRLSVRACGDEAGTWLACLAQSAEPAAEPSARAVSIPARQAGVETVVRRMRAPGGAVTTTNESQLTGGPLYELDEDYQIAQVSAACTAWGVEGYVPAGKALALRSRVAIGNANTETLLVLAPRAHAPRDEALPLIDGGKLIVRDVSSWATPVARRELPLPSTRAGNSGFVSPCFGEHALALSLSTQPPPQELTSFEYDGQRHSASVAGVLLQLVQRDTTPTALGTRTAPRLASIELVLTRGATREVSGRASCVVRAGGSGVVALGRESLSVRDYDVEVATGASIADPRTSFVFQGLVAEVTPHVAADGELSLLVRTRARVHRAENTPQRLGPNAPSTLDFADADLLAGEELVRANASGAIDARLGSDLGSGLGLQVRAKLLP